MESARAGGQLPSWRCRSQRRTTHSSRQSAPTATPVSLVIYRPAAWASACAISARGGWRPVAPTLYLTRSMGPTPDAVTELTSGALIGGQTGAGRGPAKRAAHSLLVSRGTIRMPLPWPPRASRERRCQSSSPWPSTRATTGPAATRTRLTGSSAGFVSVYRRPPSAAQMNFKTFRPSGSGPVLAGSLMWDGREPSFQQLAIDATRSAMPSPDRDPTPAELAEIVAFQTGVYSAQVRRR